MTIQALREQRGAKVREMHDFNTANKDKDWRKDPTLGEKWEAMDAEVQDLDAKIKREETLLNIGVEQRFKDAVNDAQRNPASEKGQRALYQKFLRQGERSFTPEDWSSLRNTMSTTTGSEGGYTVQSDIGKLIVDALKSYGSMRRVANVIQTAQGNPLNWPTSDGTAEVGEQVDQNTSAADLDTSFGTVPISVYKYSSKTVAVPLELLQDSVVDVEAFINQRLAQRLARITQQKFTTGTGTNEPRGVVAAATSGKVGATGQTDTVVYDDLIDLQHSVDVAYRELGRCRYMMHDDSLAVIRKLKDSQNRPLFIAGYETMGIGGKVPDTLLGAPVEINNSLATMAANAKSILFGDFSFYVIRDAMEMTLFRFTDSAYTKLGQVGFLAWLRSGGNYTDVGASMKYYQNSAS